MTASKSQTDQTNDEMRATPCLIQLAKQYYNNPDFSKMPPNPSMSAKSPKSNQSRETKEPVVYGPKPAEPAASRKDTKANEKKQSKEYIEKM